MLNKSLFVLGIFVTSAQLSWAGAEKEALNLTTQQYRVESLQDQYYSLKLKSDVAKQSVETQKARIAQTEERLVLQRKELAKREREWKSQQKDINVLKESIAVEEKKLNMIWDKTHR